MCMATAAGMTGHKLSHYYQNPNAFWLMMSQVCAGQVLPLQSILFCASTCLYGLLPRLSQVVMQHVFFMLW